MPHVCLQHLRQDLGELQGCILVCDCAVRRYKLGVRRGQEHIGSSNRGAKDGVAQRVVTTLSGIATAMAQGHPLQDPGIPRCRLSVAVPQPLLREQFQATLVRRPTSPSQQSVRCFGMDLQFAAEVTAGQRGGLRTLRWVRVGALKALHGH